MTERSCMFFENAKAVEEIDGQLATLFSEGEGKTFDEVMRDHVFMKAKTRGYFTEILMQFFLSYKDHRSNDPFFLCTERSMF